MLPIARLASRRALNPVEQGAEPGSTSGGSDAPEPPAEPSVEVTRTEGVHADGTYADSSEPPRWRDARIPHVTLLMLGLCATAFCAILYLARHLDFFFDEWSFIGTAAHWHLRDYFVPHNEHWSTVPMVIYKILLETVGLRSYLPYMAVLLLLHVSAAFLLFLIVRRRCGDVLALCAATILLFLGRGYEDLLWAFQMGFLGSVTFGLLAIYLLGADEVPGRRRAVAASAALLLSLMSSGIGLFFFAAAAVDLLRDGRRRRLLWVHIVPGIAYLWWYFEFGRQALAGDPSPFRHPLQTLEGLAGYTPAGIGTAAAGVFALATVWGPIALAGLAATAAVLWYRKRLDSGLSIGAAVGIVAQFTLTGLVRAQDGTAEATASRYVYIGAVFVLLILTEALRDARWLGLWRTLAPVTAACVVAGGAAVLVHQNTGRTKVTQFQDKELAVTWLFRNAPSLRRDVVIDALYLPVVTPSIYFATRLKYGSPASVPTLTVADLRNLPSRRINLELRTLLPLVVTSTVVNPTGGSTPPGARCGTTVLGGRFADLTIPDGQAASVSAIGAHAASQVVFSTWALGKAPDGGDQAASVSSGHGLHIRFPHTGLGMPWHFRLANNGASNVALCIGSA